MKVEGPRETRIEDLSEVLDLWNLAFRRSRGLPPIEMSAFWNENNLENMRILLVDGKPVTHVGIVERHAVIFGCKVKVGMIGGICTHPDHRGRGYATRVLADAMRKMNEDDIDICMISGVRALYDRAGAVIAGKGYNFVVRANNTRRLSFLDVDVFSHTGDHLLGLVEAYGREPVRILRSIGDFKVMISNYCQSRDLYPHLPKHLKLMEIWSDGVLAGYIVLDSVEHVARVVEYAGSRAALASSLSKVLELLSLSEIHIAVPEWDIEFLIMLRTACMKTPKSTPPISTIKVMDAEALLGKLHLYLSERLDREILKKLKIARHGTDYVFSFDKEEISVSERDITWLLFGIPEVVKGLGQKFVRSEPLMLKDGELRDITRRIFPLPIITYGMMRI